MGVSQSGQDAGVWRCPCGRQVPARFDECHCGVSRAQALAAAKAGEPDPRKPLTLLGLSLRLGAAASVIVVAAAVYLAYRPETPPRVAAPTTLPRASAAPASSPLPAEPTPAWSNDPTLWVDPGSRHEPPPDTTSVGRTESDLVKAHIEQWRALYRPAAERVARLQRDVILLESGAVPYDSQDPGRNADIRRMNELLRARLEAARKELEQARKALSDIEAGAEADGVPSGQLR